MSNCKNLCKPKIVEVSFKKEDFNMFSVSTSKFDKKVVETFEFCLGRIFDPSTNLWYFPIKYYECMVLDFQTFAHVKIIKEITESELNAIEAVIIEESDKHVLVQVPPTKTIQNMMQQLDASFSNTKFAWSIKIHKKDEFIENLNKKSIKLSYMKDKPKSMRL